MTRPHSTQKIRNIGCRQVPKESTGLYSLNLRNHYLTVLIETVLKSKADEGIKQKILLIITSSLST